MAIEDLERLASSDVEIPIGGSEEDGNVASPPTSSNHSVDLVDEHLGGSTKRVCDKRESKDGSAAGAPLFFVHPIELTFYNLPSKCEANVRLNTGAGAKWGNGVPGSQLVGVSLSSSPHNSLLALNAFLINHRNVSLITNATCTEIRARLYVHTLARSFSGQVDLPSGALVTIESSVDRTTIAEHGLSSYTLALR